MNSLANDKGKIGKVRFRQKRSSPCRAGSILSFHVCFIPEEEKLPGPGNIAILFPLSHLPCNCPVSNE